MTGHLTDRWTGHFTEISFRKEWRQNKKKKKLKQLCENRATKGWLIVIVILYILLFCTWNLPFKVRQVGEMSCRPNVLSVKCIVGQMSCRPNVLSTKCLVVQMSCRPNVLSAKCLDGEMYRRPNVCRSNVCRENVRAPIFHNNAIFVPILGRT